MVRSKTVAPSTLWASFVDGASSKVAPSTLKPRIVEGTRIQSAPSTLGHLIVDGAVKDIAVPLWILSFP